MHIFRGKIKDAVRIHAPRFYALTRILLRRHVKACLVMGPLTYARAMTTYRKVFPEFVAKIISEGNYDLSASEMDIPCYYLGSDRWLPMIFTSMYSMRYKGHVQVRYVLLQDPVGFSPELVAKFDRLFGMITLIPKEEVENRLDEELPRGKFPLLRMVRDEHVLFRKLIDVNIIEKGWRLLLDADTMFFRNASDLRSFLRDKVPFSLFDRPAIRGYLSLPAEQLDHLTGLPISAKSGRCNTGLLGIDSRQIDWEWIEFCLKRVIEICGGLKNLREDLSKYWALEMTMYAIFFAGCEEFRYLPSSEYVVSPDFREIKLPMHVFTHYCGSREALYGYSALKHVFHMSIPMFQD